MSKTDFSKAKPGDYCQIVLHLERKNGSFSCPKGLIILAPDWIKCFEDETANRIVGRCVTTGGIDLTVKQKEYLKDCIRGSLLELRDRLENDSKKYTIDTIQHKLSEDEE